MLGGRAGQLRRAVAVARKSTLPGVDAGDPDGQRAGGQGRVLLVVLDVRAGATSSVRDLESRAPRLLAALKWVEGDADDVGQRGVERLTVTTGPFRVSPRRRIGRVGARTRAVAVRASTSRTSTGSRTVTPSRSSQYRR